MINAFKELRFAGLSRKLLASLLSLILIAGLCPGFGVSPSAWAAEPDASDQTDDSQYQLIIAIDPGHGGYDPGASGGEVKEAEVNWAIAMACVDELNTYEGVKVVLTRAKDECPSLQNRILIGKAQGATVVVSLHCNLSESNPKANGSEVWVPNDSIYLYEETHVVGKALGKSILSELSALGLTNRGVKTRNCTDGEKYPDPNAPEEVPGDTESDPDADAGNSDADTGAAGEGEGAAGEGEGEGSEGEGAEGEEGEEPEDPMGGPCDWYGINYWARWNEMCGIIVEHAFLSNEDDRAKLADPEWQKAMGVADATGIAKYYGLTKKGGVVDPGDQGGSDSGDGGSDQGGSGDQGNQGGSGDGDQGNSGSDQGGTGSDPGDQGGSDSDQGDQEVVENASDATSGEGLEKIGVPELTAQTYEDNPSIMGTSKATPADLAAWYTSKGKTFPAATYEKYGAATILEFCQILCEEAQAEGVRAEVAFAQSMNETGWLRFGGQVKAEQCNFCGLGATDGGPAGADFSSYGTDAVRMGLRAQIQHLKAYASKDPLNNTCIDPRFKYVSRGCAPKVKDLSGRWASNPAYGDNLTNMINELLKSSGKPGQDTMVKVNLTGLPESLVSASTITAYVDGVATEMTVSNGYGMVKLPEDGLRSIVLYEYNTTDMSDMHAVYPTHMYVWLASEFKGNYTVTRHFGFDDLLRYAGSSIRVTGNKGIRMITGMSEQAKAALTDAGVLGYTVVETGTLLAWADRVTDGSLTLGAEGISRGRAYVKDSQNPVFDTSGGVEYYTNVLVGFNSAEQYKKDLAMRSYAVLKDASGNELVVYGGTLYRSIGYIAEQNANAFPEGTAAYEFVHGIIDACKE